MKVLIINIDSKKIPNVALKKVEKYYLDNGDEVIWDMPMFKNDVDKIYVSCVFEENKYKCDEWEGIAEIGGSGYSVEKKLPDEIEAVKPKINIGFCSRGCCNNCDFCIVRRKEGGLHAVGDIYDFWDGKSKEIELLDNNILGLPRHFEKIWGQIRKENLKVKENGLDARLINDHNARILASVRHYPYHFAWDRMEDEEAVINGLRIAHRNGIKHMLVYTIVGFNTTIKQDVYRFERLRALKEQEGISVLPYCMRHKNHYYDKDYVLMAEWVNQPWIFVQIKWRDVPKYFTSKIRQQNKKHVKEAREYQEKHQIKLFKEDKVNGQT